MRILIIGGGKLGHSLAESLIEEGHDITVVDRSDHVVERGMDTLDAMFIKGSGVSAETLKEAGSGDCRHGGGRNQYAFLPHGQAPGRPICHRPDPRSRISFQPGIFTKGIIYRLCDQSRAGHRPGNQPHAALPLCRQY